MTPARDTTLDLARAFCVVTVVVAHTMITGVGRNPSGEIVGAVPLLDQPWFVVAAWIGQIMPLFFVIGGTVGITAWRRRRHSGVTAADYVAMRMLRLARPSLPAFLFLVALLGIANLLPLRPEFVVFVGSGLGSPLWFLAAFGFCQALVPAMARLHERSPRATVAALFVVAVGVDVVRFATGIPELGLVNLAAIWLLVQQIGFWYADGWFARRRWWHLVVLAAAAYAALIALTTAGPYRPETLLFFDRPTIPAVLLGVAQACVLRLLRPALAAIMATRVGASVVAAVSLRLMTIYLWHVPVIVALTGIALLIPGASPEPASAAWWWSRIPVIVITFGLLFLVSLVVGRWERPGDQARSRPTAIVALATALTVLPSTLIVEFFLDLRLAIVAALCAAAVILLVGRRVQKSKPPPKSPPLKSESPKSEPPPTSAPASAEASPDVSPESPLASPLS